jgi:hypothetical protein
MPIASPNRVLHLAARRGLREAAKKLCMPGVRGHERAAKIITLGRMSFSMAFRPLFRGLHPANPHAA